MSKELLKSLLGDLYTDAIGEKLGDKELAVVNDGSYVPRQKFNEKEQESKDLRKQMQDRDKQLDELKTKAAGNEEMQKQIETLKSDNQKTQQEFESKLAAQKLDSAIELAIHQAGAKNVKAVRALLNAENIKLDGEKLFGFDDQLKTIKESDAYLFNEGGKPPVGGGSNPAGGGGGQQSIGMNDFIRTMAGR
jgi:Phage minor structural protein GP20.